MSGTITVVLGGGRGSRLYPLTEVRAKPAVPLGGKYRLIDIPISNAINSGLRQIFVLTQFNSASLNSHISNAFRFDHFSGGFVEVLAAEQTDDSGDWYQGTADAVRQQMMQLDRLGVENVLILSGDHLYRMDYRQLLARHEEANADITVSAIPVTRKQCEGFGVVGCDIDGMITQFKEKPPMAEDVSDLEIPKALQHLWDVGDRSYLASMGVYVFRLSILKEILSDPANVDFGKHILPNAIKHLGVAVHCFDDYWQDIGTIGSFFEANLAMCGDDPPFRFYDLDAPIYTRPRYLPPSFIRDAHIESSLVADGCVILGARITGSTVGLRSRIAHGAEITDSIMMGADWYESGDRQAELKAAGQMPLGVGPGASIKRAILDKNVRIGEGAVIHGHPDRPDEDAADWQVRDGIVILRKGAVIPAGTTV